MKSNSPLINMAPSDITNLNVEDYDGIFFFKGEDDQYHYSILRMEEKDRKFEMTDMGYKYLSIFTNTPEVDVSEAIMGDPVKIVKNYVMAKYQGIVVKKCKNALQLAQDIALIPIKREITQNV